MLARAMAFGPDFFHLRLETDYPGAAGAAAAAVAASEPNYVNEADVFSAYSSASTVGSLADQSRRASFSSQSSGDPPALLGNSGNLRYITSIPAVQDVS
ncbi:MAG: hypothetical protein M1838_001113 [Thelocarpon superellum]|nr:MAG: hypothetical protein M1838_001113 [Thelocarpon superellum]